VDRDGSFIVVGLGRTAIDYSDFNTDIIAMIDDIFLGKTVYSKNYSHLLQEPSISVGVPVYSTVEDGKIIAALFLHSYISEMDNATQAVLIILLTCLVIAVVLVSVLAAFLSRRLALPLQKMESAIQRLVTGDYKVQTRVAQDDEVGSLAEHIDQLANRLRQTSRESQKLEKMRNEFISNVSHELRTPIASIRGSLEAICDGVVDDQEQIKQYHQQMLTDSVLLQRFINDLLELNRLQNVEFSIESEIHNLTDVIDDVVRSAIPLSWPKGLSINYQKEMDSFSINGDYDRLRQMVMIVVDNAIKFSPLQQHIDIMLKKKDGRAVLYITNYGQGIEPADLTHIFDRFYTAGDSGGTGLGLSIAKQIATRHSIEIHVESEPGRTVFEFVFPESK